MRIVVPVQITDANLDSTNVVNSVADWTAGTYNIGDQAVEGHEVYEVVADPSTTDQPTVGAVANPPTWARRGWDNEYRMFRDGRDTPSTRAGGIDTSITLDDTITTFAALGLAGSEASLTVTDPIEGVVYDETKSLADIGVMDWWEFFFLPYVQISSAVFSGIPPYLGATYEFSVSTTSPSDVAEVGRVVMGIEREIGANLLGTSVTILNYGVQERNVFGDLTLVRRRTIRLVDHDISVPTAQVDFVIKQLEEVASEPTLFIGSEMYSSTVSFGIFRDATQGIDTPNCSISRLTMQTEEL